MLTEHSINVGNLLLSLSDAIDLASPDIASHQMRTAYAAWQMGLAAGLSRERLERLFTASLFHDIGALTPEKTRFQRFAEVDSKTHALRGQRLLELTPLLRPSAVLVGAHHRKWREWGEPIDHPDAMDSQIISLAETLERMVKRDRYILHQSEELRRKVTALSTYEFHPDVIGLLMQVSTREDFWLDLASPRLYSLLLRGSPVHAIETDASSIRSVAELFRSVIDFRSPFTATHSAGVAACVAELGRVFGLTEAECSMLEVAGDFHDLGKLAMPDSILNKNGGLDRDEVAVMKQHSYFSYMILSPIGGLEQVAEWAGFHHEKLDGSGYPFRVPAGRINTGSRIMAVADIFTALAEERPYRKGMSQESITRILRDYSQRRLLDSRVVDMLLDSYEAIHFRVGGQQALVRDCYEREFRQFDQTNRR